MSRYTFNTIKSGDGYDNADNTIRQGKTRRSNFSRWSGTKSRRPCFRRHDSSLALSHSPLISIINDPRSPRAMQLRRNRFNVVNRALILGHKTVERRTVAIMPRSLVSHFVSRGRRLRSDLRNDKNVFAGSGSAVKSRQEENKNVERGERKRWKREERGPLFLILSSDIRPSPHTRDHRAP